MNYETCEVYRIKGSTGMCTGNDYEDSEYKEECKCCPLYTRYKEMHTNFSPKEIAAIMNAVNDAVDALGYVAVGYDNTGMFLSVIIDTKDGIRHDKKLLEKTDKRSGGCNNERKTSGKSRSETN